MWCVQGFLATKERFSTNEEKNHKYHGYLKIKEHKKLKNKEIKKSKKHMLKIN